MNEALDFMPVQRPWNRSEGKGPQPTVLILENNLDEQGLYTSYLHQEGRQTYHTLTARSGAEGLIQCQQHSPDIILLNYRLPDLNGLEFLKRLRQEQVAIPVVIVLADERQETVAAEILRAGAADYLIKEQLTATTLRFAINTALDRAQLYAQWQQAEREKLQAEAKLQASEQQLRAFFDRALDAMLIADDSGQYVDANPAACELFGVPRSELLNSRISDFAEPGFDFAQAWNYFQTVGYMTGEFRLVRRDGSLRDVEFAATANFVPHRHLSVLRDVSDRKQTEQSLRASEELKQRILESSNDCIKVLSLEGKIVYINTGGLCLMEIDDLAPLLGKDWVSFWTGNEALVRDTITQAQAGGVGKFRGYCPTARGTPKWWDVVITPIRNGKGEVAQLLAVSRDITAETQIAAEREQLFRREQLAREQAEQANQIKDQFLAVLSHELRTPLNPILGWAKLLQTHQLDEEKTRQGLAAIERNARVQVQLIDDLLDVSRIMRGKLSLTRVPISLADTIAAAVETVRLTAAEKAIQIETQIDPAVGWVLGDAARLQQVIWNLLSNAIKFTPAQGRVGVTLSLGEGALSSQSERSTSISSFPQIHHAQLQVWDTGKGIKPEFLPYLFELFRQEDSSTTRQFGGLGLGLAISRQLVEVHGGLISASSTGEGQGATFTVRLPLLPGMPDPNPTLPTLPQSDLQGTRILVVEDEVDSLNLIGLLLQQEGATVTLLTSATTVLEILQESPIDILISDVGMPDMDGYQLIQQVRTQLPESIRQIPAIALTAYTGEGDREQTLAAGYDRHLAKPFEPVRLIETIVSLSNRA